MFIYIYFVLKDYTYLYLLGDLHVRVVVLVQLQVVVVLVQQQVVVVLVEVIVLLH
jgi:hypothetical protein